MDNQLGDFFVDKKGFLKKFLKSEVQINPLVIGFVFSYCQKEIGNDLTLFEALLRIIQEVDDVYQRSYSVFKALKSAEQYLDLEPNDRFLDLFCRILNGIDSMRFPKKLEAFIKESFCRDWEKLAKIYAGKDEFLKVYEIGKKNLRFFVSVPGILSEDIEDDMRHVVKYQEKEVDKGFLIRVQNLLRKIRFEKIEFLDLFLAGVVKSVFQRCRNLEIVQELSKKLEENNQGFDEQTRIELRMEFNSAIKEKGYGNPSNAKFVLNQYEKVDNVRVTSPDKNPNKEKKIQIPSRSYGLNQKPQSNQLRKTPPQEKPFFAKAEGPKQIIENNLDDPWAEKEAEAPSMILADDVDLEQSLSDLIENFVKAYNKGSTDNSDLISFLDTFDKGNVIFSNELGKVVKEKVQKLYKDEDFEAWESLIEASKKYLNENDYKNIVNLIENTDRKRSQGYLHIRGGESAFVSPREDPVDNQKTRSGPVEHAPSPDSSQAPNNLDTNQTYFQSLTAESINFLAYIRSDHEYILNLNKVLLNIKRFIIQKSPTAKLSLIGSSYLGTHIKTTEIDALFSDYSSENALFDLESAVLTFNLHIEYKDQTKLIFFSDNIKYTVLINNEYIQHTASLLKRYLDYNDKAKDLITLVKYWARRTNIFHSCISGYHISLLCIVFLQICVPPVLPNLQNIEHEAEVVGDLDVWYSKDLEFSSQSTLSIGELFYYFITSLPLLSSDYICDPAQGYFFNQWSGFHLSCFSLFDRSEVSVLQKGSEAASLFLRVLAETDSLLQSGESLYKIMKI